MMQPTSRRRFLLMLPGLALLPALVRPGRVAARGSAPGQDPIHPDPRPGVDASRVLTAEQLLDTPDAVPAFDGIREIPQIADGIHCYCGCADQPGYRSLLSCYEGAGMARYCDICQGQGRLAYRRWKEGQSLDQIRRAIDARYGPRETAPRGA